jgi:hypothetical protein
MLVVNKTVSVWTASIFSRRDGIGGAVSPVFELARGPVRFGHVARLIVKANYSIE